MRYWNVIAPALPEIGRSLKQFLGKIVLHQTLSGDSFMLSTCFDKTPITAAYRAL